MAVVITNAVKNGEQNIFREPQTPCTQNVMTSADVKLDKEKTKNVLSF